MDRLRVAVLFGGRSEEHDVSVKSAREVAANIDTEKYEPIYIGITREGVWRTCECPREDWEDTEGLSAVLSPDCRTRGLLVQSSRGYEVSRVDVVFPVLHGRRGEDGTIQGLLELSGIPFVGCDVPSSVLCMDKSLAYTVARSAGIATPDFRVVDADGEPADGEPPTHALGYPLFVKPARSGSSFGVTRVLRAEDLAAAIETARRYDTKVLLEQAISGSEVGCAVLENGSELIVGEVDQIGLSHGFFRIHQEASPESGSGNATVVVPARIPAAASERVRDLALRTYRALGCKGLSRVDLFLQDDGRVVLNEVNTLPGLTSYSRYPRMMAAAGMSLSKLIDCLIGSAIKGAGHGA